MKMPDHNIGCSSSNNGYSGGNYSDNYDSDPDGYITPPNEDNSNGGPNLDEDFSEYMWMENEEEFDKQEMQRLEEEALMEQCIEAMLQDELDAAQESNGQSTLEVERSVKVVGISNVWNNVLFIVFFCYQSKGSVQCPVKPAGQQGGHR